MERTAPNSLAAFRNSLITLNRPATTQGGLYVFPARSFICIPNIYGPGKTLQTPTLLANVFLRAFQKLSACRDTLHEVQTIIYIQSRVSCIKISKSRFCTQSPALGLWFLELSQKCLENMYFIHSSRLYSAGKELVMALPQHPFCIYWNPYQIHAWVHPCDSSSQSP